MFLRIPKTKEKGILEHVSFTLEDNKFVAITGPNGGGKSTLAKIIAGIEKPTEGRIFLMERILQTGALQKGRSMASAMRFSSRYALKV